MFCPNCGNNLPDNAAFCGSCGKALKSNEPAVASNAVKLGAAIMAMVLILFSILPIIFWFTDVFTLESFVGEKAYTWSEIYASGEDETIMQVCRWIGVIFLALNVVIAGITLVTGKINKKRTRFITSRFVAIINLICFLMLDLAAKDAQPSATMTFGGVMFYISCVVLFILPFFISHATKIKKAPVAQPKQ